MASVTLDHISKRYGNSTVLHDIDLRIGSGEIFFLLGPSGCGKSTLLRIIAGLHDPTSGRVKFDDRDVTRLPTEQRNAVMCFQSYALWPHMTIRENIRFGLTARNVPKSEQDQRIDEVLSLVRMSDFASRKPNQLSGGQQQRVALARALAVRPDCLLLDEPLSNLDAKLRLEMRSEIRRICKSAGFTTIYVTHDQKEALSIADRIALLKDGRLEQVGSANDLYHHPRTSFVADFIGQTNLLSGQIVSRSGNELLIKTAAGEIRAMANGSLAPDAASAKLSIRPEHLRLANGGGASPNRISGTVIESIFLGEASEHVVQVKDQKLRMISASAPLAVPAPVTIEVSPQDVTVLSE